jgi:transposase
MAVVIDLPLLAIIGAEGATEVELTTDGHRLVLTPVRLAEPVPPTPGQRRRPSVPEEIGAIDRDDPKQSLRIIQELQAKFGFTADHFKQLHHFGPKASLQTHIRYCEGTARFRAETNAIVHERLALCLRILRDGGTWDRAIERSRLAHPFPR